MSAKLPLYPVVDNSGEKSRAVGRFKPGRDAHHHILERQRRVADYHEHVGIVAPLFPGAPT